jgi:hypothetical protein
MEIKSMGDILKAHTEFVDKIQQQMSTLSQGEPPSKEALVKEKEELLAQLKQRRNTANAAKEATLRRYDREIRQYTETISHLENNVF